MFVYVTLGIIALLGLVSLVCLVAGLCAYFSNQDKHMSLLGGIGCLCCALAVVIACLATKMYDWQGYVCPGGIALGGILLLADAYYRRKQEREAQAYEAAGIMARREPRETVWLAELVLAPLPTTDESQS